MLNIRYNIDFREISTWEGRLSHIFTLCFLLFITSCSLFETRDAELPGDTNTGIFMQPDRPEVVLDNLVSAVENLNTVNYLRCIRESNFQFVPSNNAQNTNPDVWSGWTFESEQTYFSNLRAAAENTTGHRLLLSNISTELSSSNARQIFADYSLTVLHNRGNVGVPTLILGRFALEVKMSDDGLWAITSWTDISAENNFSWSDLKASFLSN
jgi:hypothetical protein